MARDNASSEHREVEVVSFDQSLAPHFESLNREWIEKDFVLEETDRQLFSDPAGQIVERGGQIFFVKWEGKVVGTCAVIPHGNEHFELAKMAVSENFQGQKIGNAMLDFALRKSRELGADKVILYSNTILEPAIHLYRKYGFREVPVTNSLYKRSNIKMEILISKLAD